MHAARLAAFSSLFALLPACGPDAPMHPDDEFAESTGEPGDDETGEKEKDDDGDAPIVNEDEEEPTADFGRAGETCDSQTPSAACQADGVAGLEFCVWTLDAMTFVWTSCMTETCATPGESRACAGGVQYCVEHSTGPVASSKRWGACGEPSECEAGETKSCWGDDEEESETEGETEDGGFEDDITMGCTIDENGRRVWNWEDCNTPLVLSFGGGVEFAAAPASAAEFAIDGGAGSCARADWPTPATPWLALDRDGSGSIDGGEELFGSATRLSSGTAPHNGFQALAELDGDADGKLSPADPRWAELVLWADHDGDRRSSGWEMLPLASFEIVEIDLGYDARRSCDGRGNCGLERARFVYRSLGREQVGEVVDVRVRCE